MHLIGILRVFFRVLLISFSLFRPGVARAPPNVNNGGDYIIIIIRGLIIIILIIYNPI